MEPRWSRGGAEKSRGGPRGSVIAPGACQSISKHISPYLGISRRLPIDLEAACRCRCRGWLRHLRRRRSRRRRRRGQHGLELAADHGVVGRAVEGDALQGYEQRDLVETRRVSPTLGESGTPSAYSSRPNLGDSHLQVPEELAQRARHRRRAVGRAQLRAAAAWDRAAAREAAMRRQASGTAVGAVVVEGRGRCMAVASRQESRSPAPSAPPSCGARPRGLGWTTTAARLSEWSRGNDSGKLPERWAAMRCKKRKKRTAQQLQQHVQERPQVVRAAQVLVLVRADGGVLTRPAELG